MREQGTVKWHAVLLGTFILAFLLRGYALSDQPALDDEVAAAFSADNYLGHGLLGQVMWYHPPLRNYVIFLSGELFNGYSAWGLRFGSVLFGSLTVPLLGYLAKAVFRDRWVGFLAAVFLCIDPLHIALSREAFQETTTAFFIVAGVLAAYRAVTKDSILFCYLAGALFGLATASKWHGFFPWAVCALAYWAAPLMIRDYRSNSSMALRTLNVLAAFLAVPCIIYVAAYIPWMLRGHDLAEFVDFQGWLVARQYIHTASEYDERYLPRGAFLWFVWPTAYADFVFHEGKARLTIAMGNFLVWALTLPCLFSAVRSWVRSRDYALGFAIALFLVSYLPLVATTRGVWAFNALAVIPFAFVLSAHASVSLMRRSRTAFAIAACYGLAAVAASALMYPMSIMRTLDYPYLRPIAELYSPHAEDQGRVSGE